MIKLCKLAAILALFVGGQALGQPQIDFYVELGGDNHVDDGGNPYNPPDFDPPFTPGYDVDGLGRVLRAAG